MGARTVLVRHALRVRRHTQLRTHAHDCRWVAGIQDREGHDAGYREVDATKANAAGLSTCTYCGGGER